MATFLLNPQTREVVLLASKIKVEIKDLLQFVSQVETICLQIQVEVPECLGTQVEICLETIQEETFLEIQEEAMQEEMQEEVTFFKT